MKLLETESRRFISRDGGASRVSPEAVSGDVERRRRKACPNRPEILRSSDDRHYRALHGISHAAKLSFRDDFKDSMEICLLGKVRLARNLNLFAGRHSQAYKRSVRSKLSRFIAHYSKLPRLV